MKTAIRFMAIAAGLLVAQAAVAQSTPPAGSTGLCKDGTYSTAAKKAGACRGHQGVKEWYTADAAGAATPSATTPRPTAASSASAAKIAAAAPAAPTPAPAPAAAPTGTAARVSPSARAAAMSQAAGGGPGLVWVNTSSNVYHCYGSDYYGKTKAGSYMSEADAKAKGAHADHGKACSK